MAIVSVIVIAVVVVVVTVMAIASVSVVAMVVIAVVVATVSVVVAGDAGFQARALRQEQPLFHGQVPFENSNLLLDIGHGIFHTFRGDDAQRVHGRDQVVVGLTKLTIIACVAHRPVKLLGVDLYPQSVWGRIPCHHIPGLETINDDDSQNDGRNHRPNQLQPVVVRKERGLAVLVISRTSKRSQTTRG